MAQRKNPETRAIRDSSQADDTIRVESKLPKRDMDRYCKFCFVGKSDGVSQLRDTALVHLKRVNKKPNPKKAVSKLPVGSSQFNLQSLYRWMGKVRPEERAAVEQLVVLHATASRRLGD